MAHSQENNVNALWLLLRINYFSSTIATDLKLATILTVIMSHSSSRACTWCEAHKNSLHYLEAYRTVYSCQQNFSSWQNGGSNKKAANNYNNCTSSLILSGNEDALMIDIFPPPELHLMLGVAITLYVNMFSEDEI